MQNDILEGAKDSPGFREYVMGYGAMVFPILSGVVEEETLEAWREAFAAIHADGRAVETAQEDIFIQKERCFMASNSQQKAPVGYDDTPMIPGQRWRVHDSKRPAPRVVRPGSFSTQDAPGRPPSDAVVLFDGQDMSRWMAMDGGEVQWKVENGYLEVVRAGNIRSRDEFGDCQLHIEWAAPAEVVGDSQGRGNSGVFLMGLYEIQVLDGYENPTYADGTTGAIYGQWPPLVNACRKPGEWQVYDVVFTAPRYEGGKLVSPAYLTVFLNGVLLHNRKEAMGPTGHKSVSSYDKPHGPKGPLMLQDHRDPVRYRNIWVRELKDYDEV